MFHIYDIATYSPNITALCNRVCLCMYACAYVCVGVCVSMCMLETLFAKSVKSEYNYRLQKDFIKYSYL